jgi:hypothetical protein
MNKRGVYGTDNWSSEHRFVYECVHGKIEDGMQIHHLDHNTANNDPRNLLQIDPATHRMHHSMLDKNRVTCRWCGKSFLQNRRWQHHCSQKCRQAYGDSRRQKDTTRITHCAYCGIEFSDNTGKKKYCSTTCRAKVYCANRKKDTNNVIKLMSVPNNHVVLSVEFYGYEDVYNMEVENDHNFCANGVFVHNCDDDMMENLYRLILLDTEYTRPMMDFDENAEIVRGINQTTGY